MEIKEIQSSVKLEFLLSTEYRKESKFNGNYKDKTVQSKVCLYILGWPVSTFVFFSLEHRTNQVGANFQLTAYQTRSWGLYTIGVWKYLITEPVWPLQAMCFSAWPSLRDKFLLISGLKLYCFSLCLLSLILSQWITVKGAAVLSPTPPCTEAVAVRFPEAIPVWGCTSCTLPASPHNQLFQPDHLDAFPLSLLQHVDVFPLLGGP